MKSWHGHWRKGQRKLAGIWIAAAPAIRSIGERTLSPFWLCMIGMSVGLLLDWRRNGIYLSSLCLTGDDRLMRTMIAHVEMQPLMHAGVAIAAIVALYRDGWSCARHGHRFASLARSATCNLQMLVGMIGGSLFATTALPASSLWPFPLTELVFMTAGMALGHVLYKMPRIIRRNRYRSSQLKACNCTHEQRSPLAHKYTVRAAVRAGPA